MTVSIDDVFVIHGMPEYTYVRRDVDKLEEKLAEAPRRRKLAVVSGRTKSGKSVLVEKMYPRDRAVWIDGSDITDHEDFWAQVQDHPLVGGVAEIRRTEGETTGASKTVKRGGGINTGIKLDAGKETAQSAAHSSQTEWVHRISPRISAPRFLDEKRIPLVIDDFHLIAAGIQKQLVGKFKAMLGGGMIVHKVPVVLLTVPQHRGVVERYPGNMTGRIRYVDVPPWEKNELLEIARLGFKSLNLDIAPAISDRFADEAQHSPNLMQEFCHKICKDNDIQGKSRTRRKVAAPADMRRFFIEVAEEGEGKELYRRMSAGLKERRRKRRQFKQGGEGDLYEVIARTLARLQKRQEESEFSFRELQDEMDVLLAKMPYPAEIGNALSRISKFKANEQDSDTVLEWDSDRRRIYINDPYLAFYLSWKANGDG